MSCVHLPQPLSPVAMLLAARGFSSGLEVHHQRRPGPREIRLLIHPIFRLGAKFEIKVEHERGKHDSHLMVGHAVGAKKISTLSIYVLHRGEGVDDGKERERETYFLPRQFRGPYENGLNASFRSLPNSAWPSGNQRSGKNSSGRWKERGDRCTAYWNMDIVV